MHYTKWTKDPRNPQAVNLLERNKAFIQDETIAWINAQIAGAIRPSQVHLHTTQQNVEEILVFLLKQRYMI